MKKFLGLILALTLVFALSVSALAANEISPARDDLDPDLLLVTDIPDDDIPLADIPDDEIPLAGFPDEDVPLIDVPDADIPLSDIPETDVPLTDIPDENVPLIDIPDSDIPLVLSPQTGSNAQNEILLTAALASVFCAAVLIAFSRNKARVF